MPKYNGWTEYIFVICVYMGSGMTALHWITNRELRNYL